ncbi:phenylalanine--tRNA ligase beta subunit [Ischnura elegans]|uniref:phenylalanine--tRNA ligase beta subunit n=1 Tax=Ischnura elegans TaxID=197161 RepID=UPI001ED88BC0|nr:phenylalanine--tRNA ligase beta subunit [Ischnura elegans]
MPNVVLSKEKLFEKIGKTFGDEEFIEVCFDFGFEVELFSGDELVISSPTDVKYVIEVPANRPDLLSIEGIAYSLRSYLDIEPLPIFKSIEPQKKIQLFVQEKVQGVRPYIVGVVFRNVTFTQNNYDSFIDLQEKLSASVGKKRSLVAIGAHDLDTLKPPFYYDAQLPEDIRFCPLNQEKEMVGPEIMEFYSHHAQLKQYVALLKDLTHYPIIRDKNGVVLSLPPLINGNHSKITLNTKNVFVECTALCKTKATIIVNTLSCLFSQYCSKRFEVEQVEIVSAKGETELSPVLEYNTQSLKISDIVSYVGQCGTASDIAGYLSRMGLKSSVNPNDSSVLDVTIPPTRPDVLHAVDIYEDVAIAFGYSNLHIEVPKTIGFGKQLPLNKLTDQLREEVAFAGFTEALTFSLCSRDDVSTKLDVRLESVPAVHISNPKTMEFQVGRTTLIPGLLKTMASNKQMPLPMKLFEISDVILLDKSAEVGARNERRICAVISDKTSGFEIIHGLLDRIMLVLEVPRSFNVNSQVGYYLKGTEDPTFFPKRCAQVFADGRPIGKIGVLHPNVVKNFELSNPCSCFEINIEMFV